MIVREFREIFNKYKFQNGIDLNRIILESNDRVEPSLLCHECSQLVVNPYYCTQCKFLYCEGCYITKKLNTCTACRQTPLINEYPPLYNIMLSKFKIYCKNKSTGCSLILYYENLLEHEDNCHHELLLCVFPDCNERIKRKNYPTHIRSCEQRLLSCPHCSADFKFSQLDQHLRNCDNRLVECYGCKKQVYNKYLEEHLEICEDVEVVCEKCSQVFLKRDIFNHTEHDCLSYALREFMMVSEAKLVELRTEINRAREKIKENDVIIQTACASCKKPACEVALKECELCKKRLCTACSRNLLITCTDCLKFFCQECFNHSVDDKVCYGCSQKCIDVPGTGNRRIKNGKSHDHGEGAPRT